MKTTYVSVLKKHDNRRNNWYTLFLFFILGISQVFAQSVQEESALRTIYHTMGGSNWVNSWNLNTSVSNWHGVTIQNGNVVGLELPNSNVTGTLPDEFKFLTNLEVLDLSGNSIAGVIPDEMTNLVNLEILNLGNNNFTDYSGDDLPRQSLKELYLNDNNFSGIDSFITNFPQLEVLDLSNNNYGYSLPSEIELLTSIKVLDLSGNAFSGRFPSELYELTTLEELYLNDNNFTGNFNDEIGDLVDLEILDISNNNMSGELHNEMDRMVSLTSFDIRNNNFTCNNIQPAYFFLSTINSFDFSPQQQTLNCSFVCTNNTVSVQEKAALSTIYHTMGGSNWINSWDLTADVSNWAGVTIEDCKVVGLELPNSNVTGTLPDEFKFLTNLEVLDLSGNSIAGVIPDEMTNLVNLEILNLGNNNFTDYSGDDLPRQSLKELYLNDNNFSGIDSFITNFPQLEVLDLSNNNYGYSLPSEIELLTSIKVLDLSGNAFSGRFPSELYELTTLEELYLNDNNFTGNFNDEIGDLVDLEILDISNNNMSGELHNEMDRMVSLTSFDIRNNNFTCANIQLAYFFLSTINSFDYSPQQQALNCSFACTNNTVSIQEKAALSTIYHTMGGSSWTNSWDLTTDVSNWTGVTIEDCKVVGLELPNSNVTGELASEFEFLTNLEILDLSGNSISGGIPDEMLFLTNLEILNLGNNNILEYSGPNIPKLNLKELYLNDNNFNGFDSNLTSFSQLEVLDLSNNNFSGTLPSEIELLSSIEILDLSGNSFGGRFPSELYELTTLKELYLNDNNFIGNFNDEIGDLVDLEILDISNNNMSGELHNEMDRMVSLTSFDISNNNFICSNIQPAYFFLSSINNFTYLPQEENINCFDCEIINFTDPIFKQALINSPYHTNVDANGDGEISTCEAEQTNLISIFSAESTNTYNDFLDITDVSEIDKFVNLETLYLVGLSFLNIDVTNNKKLKTLYIVPYTETGAIGISDIDLSQNTELIELGIQANRNLSEIDLTNNTKLNRISLQSNNLSEIDVTHLSELTELIIGDNPISYIDITNNNLGYFYIGDTNIEDIDMRNSTNLRRFSADNCQQLIEVNVSVDSLEYLTLTDCPSLRTILMNGDHEFYQNESLETPLNSWSYGGMDLSGSTSIEHICIDPISNFEEFEFFIHNDLGLTNCEITSSEDCSSETVFPDPNKRYYIDNRQLNLRLGADGSEEPFSTSVDTTGSNVEWVITPSQYDGYYYIDCVGTNVSRLRSDQTIYADMHATNATGSWASWSFTDVGDGYYYLSTHTVSDFMRLQTLSSGVVRTVASNYTGAYTQYKFTEVPGSKSSELSKSSLTNTIDENVVIYPNPTSEIINIELKNNDEASYQLFNSIGKLVKSGVVEKQIDVQNLAKGIYFLEINSEQNNITKKVIKE